MEWTGDWDLLFKLKRRHQMAPLTEQEAQDAECTGYAVRYLESFKPNRYRTFWRGFVEAKPYSYGCTSCAGEIVWR